MRVSPCPLPSVVASSKYPQQPSPQPSPLVCACSHRTTSAPPSRNAAWSGSRPDRERLYRRIPADDGHRDRRRARRQRTHSRQHLHQGEPVRTNTTSMYVYFTTDQASTVSYTVSAEGYPDYTANAITSDEAAAAYREAPPATPTVPAMSAVPARRVRRPRYRAMTSPPPSTSFWCWD